MFLGLLNLNTILVLERDLLNLLSLKMGKLLVLMLTVLYLIDPLSNTIKDLLVVDVEEVVDVDLTDLTEVAVDAVLELLLVLRDHMLLR